MKTIQAFQNHSFSILLFVTIVVASSCENKSENLEKSLEDYNQYVQDHRDSLKFYADSSWADINDRYETRFEVLAKDTTRMTDEMKANYYRARKNWLAFQSDFETAKQEQIKIAHMDSIRAALTLPEVRADYTDLGAANVLPEYEHFVTVVKNNKDVYTKEEWTTVNVNWKALNGRKRELEADISGKDKARIIKLQMEYTGIKAANRPLADNP